MTIRQERWKRARGRHEEKDHSVELNPGQVSHQGAPQNNLTSKQAPKTKVLLKVSLFCFEHK